MKKSKLVLFLIVLNLTKLFAQRCEVLNSSPMTNDGQITIKGVGISTDYSVSFNGAPGNSLPPSGTIKSDENGILVINNLFSGTYNPITLTPKGGVAITIN